MSTPVDCGPTDDLPLGQARQIAANSSGYARDIVIVHAEDDQFYALDDECSHESVALSEGFVEEDTLECPMHASAFCLKTGIPQTLPASEPVATHRVEITEGRIMLYPGLPR